MMNCKLILDDGVNQYLLAYFIILTLEMGYVAQ